MTIKSAKIKRGSAFFMAAALCLGSTSGVYAMDGNELSRLIEEARNTDISGYTPESCHRGIATSERRFYEETGQQQNNSTLQKTVTR